MRSFHKTLRWRKEADRLGPRRLLVLELTPLSTRAVIVSRPENVFKLETRFLLPPWSLEQQGKELLEAMNALGQLPEYVAIIREDEKELVRLISFSGKPPDKAEMERQVRQSLGVDDSFLVMHRLAPDVVGGEHAEYSVLAAAMPRVEVDGLEHFVRAAGGKPVSLVPGGAVVGRAIAMVPQVLTSEACRGFLYVGKFSSCLTLFHGQALLFLRQFRFGERTIVDSLAKSMQLDYETGEKLYRSGSFDIGGNVSPVLSPWLHKLEISLDFFERRNRRSVSMLYLFGDGAQSRSLESVVSAKVGRPVMPWNALEAVCSEYKLKTLGNGAEEFLLPLCEALSWVGRGVEHAV